ncbi:hypothetical protein [Shinella sp.]|uniref:hypothetical protein n=1 Tax=Shinella sp. TaxID=1870904 RepID=UPI003F6EC0EE
MKRPKITGRVSEKEFVDWIANKAAELARWIDLSVSAFPADPRAKADRLAKVRGPGGFQFFLETYLPHYVKGEHSLFHREIFARVPQILASEKGVRDLCVAPRG